MSECPELVEPDVESPKPEPIFLEPDHPIPGQNYVCVSFLSPNSVIKQKEIYLFSRYMTQKYGEFEQAIDKIIKNESEEFKGKVERDLKEKLRLELKYTYEQFKDNYESFLYKHDEQLDKDFNTLVDYKTNIRGVKIRGVYESLKEAEHKALQLQKRDQSFHVFVGSVGKWLPWDPCADRIENEEYLNEELNTLMKEYKKNNEHKDLFYEEEKRQKMNSNNKKLKEHPSELEKQEDINQKNMNTIEESINDEDPWLERQKSISGDTEITSTAVESNE